LDKFGWKSKETRARIKKRKVDIMEMDMLFDEIVGLLNEDKETQKWLLEKIKGIMKKDGETMFSELLKLFTHLETESDEAEKLWNNILKHRKKMSKVMGRPVALRVAMLDYFISVNKQIKNPKIIEIDIFEKIEKSVVTDELTGLYNKRFFMEALYREVQRARRYRLALSIMFIDIDNFKRCNELKGHPFGDNVLKRGAEIIRNGLREVDYPCRFGGDEFTTILPETVGSKTVIAAERLRSDFEKENFFPEGKFHLTVSVGIASFGIDGNSPEELVENADKALFRAKNDGKNRVYLFYREKRQFRRIATDLNISFKILDEPTVKTAKIKNVSAGGLLFENDDEIPISSILEITFTPLFKRNQIFAQARVVRLEIKENGKFDVGILFTRIKSEDQKVISELTGTP